MLIYVEGVESTCMKCNCAKVIVFNITGSFKQNEPSGMFWKPTPLPKNSSRHWRPGTQALREIRHYQWTTKLCIPKAAFIAYVNY